jgi:NAD(P)-dependent dehydrogenase (short-subunit alcohol dehydrogenase family)
MNLEGTSALVTGGASGLGAATARALAKAGGLVAVLDRDRTGGEAIAAETGGIFAEVDVRAPQTIEAALAAVAAAHGPARVVVNCAGIGGGGIRTAGKRGPHPIELLESLLGVHVVGTFNVCRLAAAAMLAAEPGTSGERGILINTSSLVAQDGPVGMVAHSAAKGAIEAMTLPMARDLAPAGIRVCGIVPGNFDTPMAAPIPAELKETLIRMTPFPKRFGDPAEYAALARHLIENQMMNGINVRIDGGIRMSITG